MCDSIDHKGACGFMACVAPHPKFKQESHTVFKVLNKSEMDHKRKSSCDSSFY